MRQSRFLTPVEIQFVELGRAVRGYERERVDGLLEDAASSYERVWRERDDLCARVAGLEDEVASVRERDRLLGEVLGAGHELSEQLRDRARAEGETVLKKARARAEAIVADAAAERERLLADVERLRAEEAHLRAQAREFHAAALALLERERSPDGAHANGHAKAGVPEATAEPS